MLYEKDKKHKLFVAGSLRRGLIRAGLTREMQSEWSEAGVRLE